MSEKEIDSNIESTKSANTQKEIRKQMSPILGSHLKQLRQKYNLTLAEAANRSKLTPQVISYYERALRIPSVESLGKLASVYDEKPELLVSLREATVMDTVRFLGEEAPANLRTERNMIAHANHKNRSQYQTEEHEIIYDFREPNSINGQKSGSTTEFEAKHSNKTLDSLSLGDDDFASEEEIEKAKAYILALRMLKNNK